MSEGIKMTEQEKQIQREANSDWEAAIDSCAEAMAKAMAKKIDEDILADVIAKAIAKAGIVRAIA